MSNNTAGDLLAGLIFGAVVGAGIGILYAPKSGKETRTMIREKAEAAAEKAAARAEECAERAIEAAEKATQTALAAERKLVKALEDKGKKD